MGPSVEAVNILRFQRSARVVVSGGKSVRNVMGRCIPSVRNIYLNYLRACGGAGIGNGRAAYLRTKEVGSEYYTCVCWHDEALLRPDDNLAILASFCRSAKLTVINKT